jgi:prepilin-type N-terminal cleavage/methylation domain-containing protein
VNGWNMNYEKNRLTPKNLPESMRRRTGFTLIELLVVISIIAVLTALTVPVLGAIKRKQYIAHATSEMELIRTAIENYHSAFGYYPPSSPISVLTPQLYYELTGVKIVTINNVNFYSPLDGNSAAQIPVNMVQAAFGVGGFMNCTKGSGEEATVARSFLTELRANQYSVQSNFDNTVGFDILVSSIGGPNPVYQPINKGNPINPWRYNSLNPTNNPQSYDLWVDLAIGSQTNRISNWNKQVINILN